ncbi:MAG: hypothetical protein ABEI11_01625 [Haloarculaceae archaeon]
MASVPKRLRRRLPATDPRRARAALGRAARSLSRVVFGDRIGVAVFLAAVTFVAVYWRVGVFINDNYTIANALVNVADGHLSVEYVVYGPESGATPGMVVRDGTVYGRYYGIVFAALPFLWAWRAVATVADPRIAAVALWSLGLLALAVTAGRIVDRRREAAVLGSGLALGSLAVNGTLATPLESRWLGLLALQTSTVVWAGLLGVFVYRLLARIHGPRVGAVAGLAAVLATPVGFWASIPKRHVLVGLFAVLVAYALYRAREPAEGDLRFRAASYALVGLCAWASPYDAALIFVVFAPIDLLTARSNDPRRLVALAAAFAVSLVPFLLTNFLVTGQPLKPPRMLTPYDGQGDLLTGDAASDGESASEGGSERGSGSGQPGGGAGTGAGRVPAISTLVAAVATATAALVEGALERTQFLWSFLDRSLDVVVNRPDRLHHVFVRSGYIEGVASEDGSQAISLSVLESMPLAGPLLAAPVARLRRRASIDLAAWARSPRGAVDLFALAVVVLFPLGYLHRLPVHASVTVRYLVPAMPFLLYLVARLPAVRAVVRGELPLLAASYAGTVFVGGQLLVLVVALRSLSLGEAVQLHAVLALAAAATSALWLLASTVSVRERARLGAAVLGATAGLTTVFLLLSGLEYFAYAGDFLLPAVRWLGDALALV